MSLPVYAVILIASITLILFSTQDVFSQVETSEQTTLSGNLVNDPLAQDILKKIEHTKQWIAELEQREYEKIEAQKFLNERRAIALESLNRDLLAWEELWANYTSKNAFERFVDKKPEIVQGVFWDQFEFKEMKVNAGRSALKAVLAEGGSLKEARNAYLKAAETKRIELIEANAQFNVKHNLAYYSQQLLFNVEGKYVNSTENSNALYRYYTDFRASPSYLAANPDDIVSYESLGKTHADTQCREGYVVVYRYHARDYACITESTAEMWVQRGMGEITEEELTAFSYEVQLGKSQIIKEELDNKDLQELVISINKEFEELSDQIEIEKAQLVKKYKIMYDLEEQESRDEEQKIIQENYNEMTAKEISDLILAIRDKYKDSMEQILDEKLQALDELEKKFDEHVLAVKQEHENNSQVEIIWDSDFESYRAIIKISTIDNFEDCTAAGNPVMESYPRQCRTQDGKLFVEQINNTPNYSEPLEVKIKGDNQVRRGTTHTLEIQVVRGDIPIEGARVFLDIEDYGENIIKEFKGYTDSQGYFIFSWEIPQSFDDIETLLAIVDVTDDVSSKTVLFKFQVYCLAGEENCKVEGN